MNEHFSPQRAPGLDLLRAAAITAVMLYHASSHGIALPRLVESGWMGVDLFFVLSGYLIGWQVLRRRAQGLPQQWGQFFLRRAWRVLPAYYAVLTLYTLAPAWREAEGMQPFWKFATFTVNLTADWREGRAFAHAWSLCVEEHFYVLFPLALWLLGRQPHPRTVALLAAGLLAGGVLLRAAMWHFNVAPHLAAQDMGAAMLGFTQAVYNPTYARLDGLLAGVMLAAVRAYRPQWWEGLMAQPRKLMLCGAFLLALCAHWQLFSAAGAAFMFPMVALGCAALVAGALSPRSAAGRVPLPGMRLLAELAFSLYLTHKAVFSLLDAWWPELNDLPAALALAGYAGVSLLAALLLHGLVEKPGLKLRERWLQAGSKDAAGRGAQPS